MNIERALKKIENWRRTMIYCCIIFAFLTFIFLAPGQSYNYVWVTVRFWICFTATVFFAVLAATVNRIQRALTLIYEEMERK